MANTTKKAIEEKFNSASTRVTRTISEFDKKELDRLKQTVEKVLNRLKSETNDVFDYTFSQLQHTSHLAFKLTKGYLPTSSMNVIQQRFPGATIPPSDNSNNSQVLLIPKTLCKDLDELDLLYEIDSDDEGNSRYKGRPNNMVGGGMSSKKMGKIRIYSELLFWILVVASIVIYYASMMLKAAYLQILLLFFETYVPEINQ